LRHVYVTAAASSINLVSLTINCGRRYADRSINTIGQWLPLLTFIFLRGLRQFIVHVSLSSTDLMNFSVAAVDARNSCNTSRPCTVQFCTSYNVYLQGATTTIRHDNFDISTKDRCNSMRLSV